MPQLLALLSTIIITGSLFYYLYALTNGVILIMLAIVLVFVVFKTRGDTRPSATTLGVESTPSVYPRTRIAILIPLFLVIAAAFYILFTHQTTEALRSPWEVVPLYFFLLYGAAVFITIISVGLLHYVRNDSKRGVTHCGAPARVPAAATAMPSERGAMGQDPEPWANRLSLFLLTFLTLAISLIIFPLGAGFDPFIHQATEKIIAATGTITPKPLYYIGQYTLVVFLSKILGVSVVWIDKLLVPLLASIFLPLSIGSWIKRSVRSAESPLETIADASMERNERVGEGVSEAPIGHRRGPHAEPPSGSPTRERVSMWGSAGRTTIISFLLLPFLLTPFTVTTPYSLALLLLVVLIFHVTCNTKHVTFLAFAIAFAILLIHPIVGIPACIFLFISYLQKYKNKLLHVACYMLCAFAIPTAFLIASQFSSQIHITFAPQNFLPWLQSIEWGGIYRENRFNALFDLLYFYGFNIKNIFLFFVLTAIVGLLRRSTPRNDRTRGVTRGGGPPSSPSSPEGTMRSDGGEAWQDPSRLMSGPAIHYLATFLILLTSYIFMSGFLSFSFLIGYEQADYAKRVLDIAQLFLLPLFLLGIQWWITKIPRSATIALLTLAIPASLFLAYPQKIDSYSVSHAWNTSQADIDAVRWIDADARGENYIVLANQAVSAAAIRELGFKKYYLLVHSSQYTADSIFFYPIPTGSPLYKFYLNMVYKKASSETMQEAMQLVEVNRAYFVLNRYWNDFDRIFTEAQQNLQLVHSINNSVFIFILPNH